VKYDYNCDCAYANGFKFLAVGLDVSIVWTEATNGDMHFGTAGEILLDGCLEFKPRVLRSS